jgi:hypothetical protein
MGEAGEPHPVGQDALVELIAVLGRDIRLVVLNACYTRSQAEAIARVVDCCIGMNAAIGDKAAIVFAAAFYRAIGFGQDVETAYRLGKSELKLRGIPEDKTPELFCLREAVDPAKVVLLDRPSPMPSAPQTIEQQNRARMIEKVRTIWITGFLQKSLFQEVRIILGLNERPDAVVRPLDLLVRRPDECERPLPAGIQVVDVFDSMDRSVLILGAPGAGKTTLLLELARDLLDRAAQEPAHAIPVVFPLSTWAESRKPLVEWLVDELNLRYDVPRKTAEGWVASDEILPLFDGLDEVKSEYRAACVQAINAFRQTHGFLPLAVSSRIADYESLGKQVRLHGAILVRPLTQEQVITYLADLGPSGEPVRAAIHEDPSLWELLDNPLLLNVVTVAYSGQPGAPPRLSGTMPQRRDRLFGAYVDQMLPRRGQAHLYRREQTVHSLSWLAHQMDSHGQTVFEIERLQLDWLPQRQRKTTRTCTLLVPNQA